MIFIKNEKIKEYILKKIDLADTLFTKAMESSSHNPDLEWGDMPVPTNILVSKKNLTNFLSEIDVIMDEEVLTALEDLYYLDTVKQYYDNI